MLFCTRLYACSRAQLRVEWVDFDFDGPGIARFAFRPIVAFRVKTAVSTQRRDSGRVAAAVFGRRSDSRRPRFLPSHPICGIALEPRTCTRTYTAYTRQLRARCKQSALAGEWKIYFFQVVVPQRLATRVKTGKICCKSLQINDLARCSILRHFGLGRGPIDATGQKNGLAPADKARAGPKHHLLIRSKRCLLLL